MSVIQQFWRQLTQPYQVIDDVDTHRDAVTLSSVSLAVLCVAFGGVLVTVPSYSLSQIIALLPVILSIPLFLFPYYLSRQGRTKLAAHALVIVAWILITSAVWAIASTTGIETTYYYVMIPIFSSLYHRYRSTIIYFILAILSPLLLMVFSNTINLIDILRGPVGFIFYMSSFVSVFAYLAYGRELDKREQLRIGERKNLELVLMQKQNDILANFVRAITHDFRTRLQSIKLSRHMISRLVNKQADAAMIDEKLDLIDINVSNISEELDKLALLLTIDQNSGEPILVNDIIKILASQYQEIAANRQINFAIDLETCPPFWGKADYLRIIIQQLVDNAFNNTSKGGHIRIVSRCQLDEAIIEVSDTGVGIAPEHLDNVFDVFYKVDEARTVSNTGMGLGLAITKTLVEAYQGTITMVSQIDEGTTVTLRFPLIDSA